MFTVPYERMICDSDFGDGGLSFYDDYVEWLNRDNGKGFKIYYRDIEEVKIISGIKKKVIVVLKDGSSKNLYLYKADTLKDLLYKAAQRVDEKEKDIVDVEATQVEEDDITKLERLAKLHASGALTDEEFALAKQKILKSK